MTSIQEKPRLLLVDFENVQQVELSRLDDSFRVVIFVGVSQKNVPFELVTSAQKLGSRVEWHKVTGEGRNALDFFIAFELGRVFANPARPECVVLSKDKGFDPLLNYLGANGVSCRRVNHWSEVASKHGTRHAVRHDVPAAPAEDPNYRRVVEVLGKSEKRSRPRKRKTLSQAISAMFQKKIRKAEVDRIIDALLASGVISEANNTITYEF